MFAKSNDNGDGQLLHGQLFHLQEYKVRLAQAELYYIITVILVWAWRLYIYNKILWYNLVVWSLKNVGI